QCARAAVDTEAQAPEHLRVPERREVDAVGGPGARVECVDERRAARAVVERVGPTPVRAGRARQRVSAHLVAALRRVGHWLADESYATAGIVYEPCRSRHE